MQFYHSCIYFTVTTQATAHDTEYLFFAIMQHSCKSISIINKSIPVHSRRNVLLCEFDHHLTVVRAVQEWLIG